MRNERGLRLSGVTLAAIHTGVPVTCTFVISLRLD